MDCTIQIVAGRGPCSVYIGGVNTGTVPANGVGAFNVQAFQAIMLSYSIRPSWGWSAI
jgi:hypothetical protein